MKTINQVIEEGKKNLAELHKTTMTTEQFFDFYTTSLLKAVEEMVKENRRIGGAEPYMWLITSDTPMEIGRYDEHHRIIGYNTALSDLLKLLTPNKE